MRLIFTSYVCTPEYSQPEEWLKRIEAYTGILEELSKNHHVVGIERIKYEGQHEKNNVTYIFTRLKRNVVHFPISLHRLIKKLNPDVVFINGLIFPLQILQLRLAIGRKVKIIVLHRAEKPFKGIKRYLQKLADKCVNAYLFTSAEFAGEWQHNISRNKIHEIIQASSVFSIRDKQLARSKTNAIGSPVFLWVGRLDHNKDPLTIISAFINFLDRHPTASLYLIYQNDDLLPEIKKLIDSNRKAAGSIHLVGKVPHQQLQDWFNSADFFFSGSHYEGGGTSVLEAMSCGCIPIVTNIPSFRRMTGPGKCGLLFSPGNEKELLEALLAISKMDVVEGRKSALKQFNEEFSFEAIGRKIEVVINTLNQLS